MARPASALAWATEVGDGAGEGLGVGGQPVGAVQVTGLGDRGGQAGERPGLAVGVGDGAGEGLGAVQVTGLGGRGGQAGKRLGLGVGAVMVRARVSASAASRWARSRSPAWAAAVARLRRAPGPGRRGR